MKQTTHFFFKVGSPTLKAITWWKNEKDWTQALSSFLIKLIECVIEWFAMPLCQHNLSMFMVWDFI